MRWTGAEAVRRWASQLAAESRDRDASRFYVLPESLFRIWKQLQCSEGCIIAVVGLQGVGKSSALLTLERVEKAHLEQRDVVLFKWQREKDLYESLLEENHEASRDFLQEYKEALANATGGVLWEPRDTYRISVRAIEKVIGKNASEVLRRRTWLDILRIKKVILIDTPDYSRTDKRAMARDLNDIYRLWVNLCKTRGQKPNIVLAVQKEMFGGHFFFDKMQKIDLEPLQSGQMIDAYTRRFGNTQPFTEEALPTLARMSRGIFRRFLRYITLTLDLCQTRHEPLESIDPATVKEAVTLERLAEDMELELAEVFPRQSDAPRQAVQVFTELEEHGPLKQGDLVKRLDIEDYALSRLLARLEMHRYVKRERSGTDKIVALART